MTGNPIPGEDRDPIQAPHLDDFDRLISSYNKRSGKAETLKFVKRLEDVPEVALPPEETIQVALSLADRALIGQFTGLWPSPKTTDTGYNETGDPLSQTMLLPTPSDEVIFSSTLNPRMIKS